MKIATKLTARIAEFVNENDLGSKVLPDSDIYFHIPCHTDFNRSALIKCNYTEVTEQQFIDMVSYQLYKKGKLVNNIINPIEMKTKCIVLGQENEPVKELKKIEFTDRVGDVGFLRVNAAPNAYKTIELICFKYTGLKDLMFAYDDDRNDGSAYLGHWNDGIS